MKKFIPFIVAFAVVSVVCLLVYASRDTNTNYHNAYGSVLEIGTCQSSSSGRSKCKVRVKKEDGNGEAFWTVDGPVIKGQRVSVVCFNKKDDENLWCYT